MVAASVIITATMITICYINSRERTHRYALPLQIMLTISTAGMPGLAWSSMNTFIRQNTDSKDTRRQIYTTCMSPKSHSPLPMKGSEPHGFIGPMSPHHKRHFDRFSGFGMLTVATNTETTLHLYIAIGRTVTLCMRCGLITITVILYYLFQYFKICSKYNTYNLKYCEIA